MRRALVTGASGFIGSRALAPLLERGFTVHAVARGAAPRGATDGVTWHAADLLEEDARRDLVARVAPSHLLHLAWYAEPGLFWRAPENAAWMHATIALVEEFAAAGGARAVLAGTCAEYDWADAQPLREDAARRPATFYGECKDATHQAVSALAADARVSLAWGRIFFLYGPGEDERRLVAAVARALAAGEQAPTSAGTQVRDFLHVDDVAGAFAALVDSDVRGAVNIASGEGVTVRSIVEQLAQAAGRPDLLDVGALPARSDDPPEIVADIGRLRDEVGFASATPLADGLTRVARWWRHELSGRRRP